MAQSKYIRECTVAGGKQVAALYDGQTFVRDFGTLDKPANVTAAACAALEQLNKGYKVQLDSRMTQLRIHEILTSVRGY